METFLPSPNTWPWLLLGIIIFLAYLMILRAIGNILFHFEHKSLPQTRVDKLDTEDL